MACVFFSPPPVPAMIWTAVWLFSQGPQYVLAEIPTNEYAQVADL